MWRSWNHYIEKETKQTIRCRPQHPINIGFNAFLLPVHPTGKIIVLLMASDHPRSYFDVTTTKMNPTDNIKIIPSTENIHFTSGVNNPLPEGSLTAVGAIHIWFITWFGSSRFVEFYQQLQQAWLICASSLTSNSVIICMLPYPCSPCQCSQLLKGICKENKWRWLQQNQQNCIVPHLRSGCMIRHQFCFIKS